MFGYCFVLPYPSENRAVALSTFQATVHFDDSFRVRYRQKIQSTDMELQASTSTALFDSLRTPSNNSNVIRIGGSISSVTTGLASVNSLESIPGNIENTSPPPPTSDPRNVRKTLLRVGYLGFCFSLLFTAFNVAQSWVTTLFPGYFGFISLCIVYITFGIGSILAPFINRRIILKLLVRLTGDRTRALAKVEKVSMAIGAGLYGLFILSIALQVPWLIILASALTGLGAGMLWVSEGVWLTKQVQAAAPSRSTYSKKSLRADPRPVKSAPESAPRAIDTQESGPSAPAESKSIVGTATGIFFTLFNLNGLFGNAVVLAILRCGLSSNVMIWSMFGICAVGICLFSFVPESPLDASMSASEDSEPVSVVEKLKDWYRVACLKESKLLTPYLLCNGINIAFNFGNFPTYISVVAARGDISDDGILMGFAFLLYGLGCLVGSILWGRLL
jgi:hypothetical protein